MALYNFCDKFSLCKDHVEKYLEKHGLVLDYEEVQAYGYRNYETDPQYKKDCDECYECGDYWYKDYRKKWGIFICKICGCTYGSCCRSEDADDYDCPEQDCKGKMFYCCDNDFQPENYKKKYEEVEEELSEDEISKDEELSDDEDLSDIEVEVNIKTKIRYFLNKSIQLD